MYLDFNCFRIKLIVRLCKKEKKKKKKLMLTFQNDIDALLLRISIEHSARIRHLFRSIK